MTHDECLAHQLEISARSGPMGVKPASIPGVEFFWTTVSLPLSPSIYEAGLIVLFSGAKQGVLGERGFVCDADNYLVLSLPMTFECEHVASPEEPVCGLFISIDREDLAVLLSQLAGHNGGSPKWDGSAISSVPLDEGLRAVSYRMLATMDDADAGRIIGPSLRREALFHALRGPCGGSLAALAYQGNDESRIDRLIRDIRADLGRPVSIEQMSLQAGMSQSAFHRAFRTKTGQSPLQYVKQLRLHAARQLITFEGVKVGSAARQVGYESNSQFSREYRRYFGESPTETRVIAWQGVAHRRV